MEFRSDRCTPRDGGGPSLDPPRALPGRRGRRVAILLALGALACMVGAARSFELSDPGGRDRLLAELDRTDRVIERATEHAADCASPKAKLLLRQAREMQAKARELYETGGQTMPVDRVFIQTRRARELAVDAIEQCQVESKAQESLRTMLDATANLLNQAETTVTQSTNLEARRLLEASAWQLDRARAAYRDGEYRRAILLGGVARNLALRAVDRARGLSAEAGSRLDVALDRTDALLSEVRSAAGWSEIPKARALLERAEREQDQARALQSDGGPAAALQRTRIARETALDALWLLQRTPDPERLKDAISMVSRLVEQATPEIDATSSPEAEELLRKSIAQLRAAEESIAAGEYERAAAAVRAADSLLRRAVEKSER